MNLQHKLGSVQILSQYPVKGLDAQNLPSIDLHSAVDRTYALLYTSRPSSVSSAGWRHKSNFLCAYTAGKLLKKFQTFFSQNGTKIVEFPVEGPEWDKLIANSKFADWEDFAAFKTGKIGLQDHGNVVAFRNIKIKEL